MLLAKLFCDDCDGGGNVGGGGCFCVGGGVAAGVGGKIVTGGGGCFIITVDPFMVKSVGGLVACGGAPLLTPVFGAAVDDDDGGVEGIPPVEDLELVVTVSVLLPLVAPLLDVAVVGAIVFGGVGVAVTVTVVVGGGVAFPPEFNGDIGGICNSAQTHKYQNTHFSYHFTLSAAQRSTFKCKIKMIF